MDHHAATSIFWEMRLTGYLVLFWYLSLRNAYRYSDPSVWEGRFIDEVRLLTAMKQNLKQIKRHFPQLDSCFFQLAQVLHLKTESGTDSRKEGCAYTLMHMFGRNAKHFFFVLSVLWELQCQHFGFLTSLPHYFMLVSADIQHENWSCTVCRS